MPEIGFQLVNVTAINDLPRTAISDVVWDDFVELVFLADDVTAFVNTATRYFVSHVGLLILEMPRNARRVGTAFDPTGQDWCMWL
ncbi:MAG: hypothetical protein AAGD43_02795 [Pseudomonadota bacterium]